MDAFTFSSIAFACGLVPLAVLVALGWRRKAAGYAETEQPKADGPMRRELRHSPAEAIHVGPCAKDGENAPVREMPAPPVQPDQEEGEARGRPSVVPACETAPKGTGDREEIAALGGSNVAHVSAETTRAPAEDVAVEPSIKRQDAETGENSPSADGGPKAEMEISAPSKEPFTEAIGAALQEAESADAKSEHAAPTAEPVTAEKTGEKERGLVPQPEQRPRATHRDRRGRKRQRPAPAPGEKQPPASDVQTMRPPAELKLRLMLHPFLEAVELSLMFMRPEGFPEQTAISMNGTVALQMFDDKRYDDVDIAWAPDILADELRFESSDGFRWLRSARRIHIFRADPSEAGMISVSSAQRESEHVVLCKIEDEDTVRTVAAQAGSSDLRRLEHWHGISDGWCVLLGYRPVRAAAAIADSAFRPLDPGFDLEIRLTGGVQLRAGVFAQGHAPTVQIPALPDGVSVTIDSMPARQGHSGGWEADGWDRPGPHLIDTVPGPSLGYEIAADPAEGEGWKLWDAHSGRFAGAAPWAQAWICGAAVAGPAGETVLTHEARPSLVALGSRGGVAAMLRRMDADVSIGFAKEPPTFLLVSWGHRRSQGEVVWLGLDSGCSASAQGSRDLAEWASIVRNAAARRLPLRSEKSGRGRDTWLQAVRRARNLKRRRA